MTAACAMGPFGLRKTVRNKVSDSGNSIFLLYNNVI